jgi:parvulin-like peptidyl-prolyl isomerase
MTLAIVNGFNIEKLDYLLELAILTHDETIASTDESIKKDVIVHMIDDMLILQHAVSLNINVSNEEVEEKFLDILLELNSQYDFSEFLIENHINENHLMRRVKNHLIIHRFIEEFLKNNIIIPDKKLLEIYNENLDCFNSEETVHVYHILIEDFNNDAFEKITMMKNNIKTADDFFFAVQSCSECPTCCQSGDLGYHTRGELIPEIDNVVFNMSENQISEPVKTSYGWHLFLVTEKKCQHKSCFDDIKEALRSQMIEMETELKIVHLLKELKNSAEISIFFDK